MDVVAGADATDRDSELTVQTVVLRTADHPGVRVLTLDDPQRRNAIGTAMKRQLAEAVATVAADPEARVLVVTGAGSAFCAGAHLDEIFGGPPRPVSRTRHDLAEIYRSFLAVRDLDLLTIAAVQGPAVGAGFNLAMCCDLRIAGPQASFGVTFSRIGLHPGGGATFFLVDALGPQRAMQILLDGATLGADRARDLGLVLDVVADPVAAALAAAARYADLDPWLTRHIKQSVRIAGTDGLAASLQYEAWAQAATASDPAVLAGLLRGRR
ncbi:enoyl-CoA hydratase-related protein [Solwaraspora sp. WMMD791]|uniref:enoyl-CoA hydratase-related protein n=1 Tax=Solwaraspora sp. WMMD791 TaxID=3016086 RepID=UPI00249C56C0|nr:enoyl-CoA hydratase-related protein [Solwaraspora sp. WMMD791]WFE28443.1 enoyl-CoA hydratase-related protein [Solwaraspora sp. WMMD791]